MAKITTNRCATVKLSDEDWNKIVAVYDMLHNIENELIDTGLELDSPEVKYENFDEGYSVGDHLQSIMYDIDELNCIRRGLFI